MLSRIASGFHLSAALAAILVALTSAVSSRADSPVNVSAIVSAKNASFAEKLAAKEIRRYFYLRTGKLLPIIEDLAMKAPREGGLVVVGAKGRPAVQTVAAEPALQASLAGLAAEQYMLKTIGHGGRAVVLVAGGDEIGTLYGAYRLAERMGVRFYLDGDVVPDQRMTAVLPVVDEVGKPLFQHRGIQPFHDFPEGPDWWNADGYKAILAQLPKLRMNFFGLHTYPEGGVGPEPLTWIGRAEEIGEGSRVKAAYPSRHFTAASGTWGYRPMKTGDYLFGAAALFDRDDYGADYMRGMTPWPKTPEDQNELFSRMGSVLHEAFGFARRLGIKTCIGTETPLAIPTAVRKRLEAAGKNPSDPAVVQALYEGMFRRIAQTHPLDFYWFWTPEDWTWTPVSERQISATSADFRAAIAAAEKVHAPFTLATCGWVLGPPKQPALFDDSLPKQMPMSCINRQVGFTPVEPGFAKVQGRPKWAIPWMEDDPGLTAVQLWAGRMRQDAADAPAYGCTGLLGIHWRTRILGPNVAALAAACWDQKGWKPGTLERVKSPAGVVENRRYVPVADFYDDWARAEFGPAAGPAAAALFAKLDGHLPRPANWTDGPGGIKPDSRNWHDVSKEYDFAMELCVIQPRVDGAGNLERFHYWLNNFRYMQAVAEANCTWGRFEAAMKKVRAETDPAARKRLARELALPIRKALVKQLGEAMSSLLDTVTTAGEMGTVANWQQHNFPAVLTKPGQELAKLLGEPLPADAMPSQEYEGEERLFVPVVRTSLIAGEPLALRVIILGAEPRQAAVYYRPLGPGPFAHVPLTHVARGVYTVTLPAAATRADFEYNVQAGGDLCFPPTVPELNQTVVVVDGQQ